MTFREFPRNVTRTPGIYFIKHKPTGRMYVGSTVDVKNRIWSHANKLRKNIHNNKGLQECFNADGESVFEVGLIQYELDTLKRLDTEFEYTYKLNALESLGGFVQIVDGYKKRKFSKQEHERRQKTQKSFRDRPIYRINCETLEVSRFENIKIAHLDKSNGNVKGFFIGRSYITAKKYTWLTEEEFQRTVDIKAHVDSVKARKAESRKAKGRGTRKLVLNTETGVYYESVSAAARSLGVNIKTFSQQLHSDKGHNCFLLV